MLDKLGFNEDGSIKQVKTTHEGIKPATLMLWKKVGEKWRDEELVPVKSLDISTNNSMTIRFLNGDSKMIVFGGNN